MHALCPLGPAPIVETFRVVGETCFCQSCVNDGGGYAGATAGDDGFGGIDALGFENGLQV